MSEETMSKGSNALNLVKSELPDLRYGPEKTSSDSPQDIEFKGTLCYWSEFEREVRKCVLKQEWKDDIPDHQLQKSIHPSYLYNEHYCCGDKMSVQGRFAQRIGQIMTAVFMILGMDVNFGDYKTCVSPPFIDGKIPDFAVLSAAGMILAAGEAKTPWKHKPAIALKSDFNLRHILGQVIRYVIRSKLKFGFLTTYEQTIFIKQETVDGKVVIYYSNVINHNDTFQEVPGSKSESSSSPEDYHGKVTLRECFLYLGAQVFPDDKYPKKHTVTVPKAALTLVTNRPKSRKAGISKTSFEHTSDNKNIPPPYISAIPPLPELQRPEGSRVRDPSHGPAQSEHGEQTESDI